MKQYFLEKWTAIKLFFSNLFKRPAKSGYRRLIKNPTTGKLEWSEGEEPKFEEVKAVAPEVIREVTREIDLEKVKTSNFIPFEPKIENRFIINFPSIEPYLFNRYTFHGKLSSRKMSNGKTKVREHSTVQMYLPVAIDNDLEVLKMSKLKNLGTVSVEILDATGVPIRQIVMKNVKIEEVNIYSDMSYDDKDLMTAYVSFSHDQREIK